MHPETPKAGCHRPPTPTHSPETVTLDEALMRRLAVALAAIDRETRRYRRKREGLEPWSVFELPASLRRTS